MRTEVYRRYGLHTLLIVHAALVTVAVSCYAVASHSTTRPEENLGAALVLLPMWPLALPWCLLALPWTVLPAEPTVLGGAVGNLLLHAVLLHRRSRRALVVSGVLMGVMLGVTGTVAVSSGLQAHEVRRQALAAVSPQVWLDPRVDGRSCWFCVQDMRGVTSGRPVAALTEPHLLAATDAPLTAAGWRPDRQWSCDTDAETHVCSRTWLRPGATARVLVEFELGHDPQLWLDVSHRASYPSDSS